MARKALAGLTAGQGVVAGLPATAQNRRRHIVRQAGVSEISPRSIADLAVARGWCSAAPYVGRATFAAGREITS
jgi:hypothetical protein